MGKKEVTKIRVIGAEEKQMSLKQDRKGLLGVKDLLFNKVVDCERENMVIRLSSFFKGLRYEDLEEVYSDGCLVLWEKLNQNDFRLEEKSLVGYLFVICRNIGRHYLRKVDYGIESLDLMMEVGSSDIEIGMEDFFDVLEEKGDDDMKYERLEKVWEKLKDVDRMILESYYVDGFKMEEIAKKVGLKNADTVKSKKNKIIRRMLKMMVKEGNSE